MPDWPAFWAVAGFVLLSMLALAWTTSSAFGERGEHPPPPGDAERGGGERVEPPEESLSEPSSSPAGPAIPETNDSASRSLPELSRIPPRVLLLNVLVTHGGLGLLLLGAAGLTGVPLTALGVAPTAWSTGALAIGGGVALGAALAVVNTALAATLDRVGIEHSEALRSAMAPESVGGWLLLLGAILPLVAAFEELLFRAVLVGGAAAATGLSPWLFVVPSSIAFSLGHGLQGRGGVIVTGLLGAVLAVAFVLTNSLLLVVLAHYVINATEFLGKEWLGLEPEALFSRG